MSAVSDHIETWNRRAAAIPPRPVPRPAGMSQRDLESLARSPAVQAVQQHNARVAAAEQAKLAQEDAERREWQRAQAAALATAAEIEAQRAAAAEHEQRIRQAIRAMAEDYIKQQSDAKESP